MCPLQEVVHTQFFICKVDVHVLNIMFVLNCDLVLIKLDFYAQI